eukprot:CAMPEP_0116881770 /NCGR_PEP_ID=MMETSP0463-20121206/13825_1 /TAXON_ID=181622 /ORGANISM="Strombidinopsis sp, Strain SopsisLIS2011" /LENGTH=57 /DNA_ID=CAMNT_0004533933 /DNA_START=835 /DNA_END=1008 /DNA_ORIENTATION=-
MMMNQPKDVFKNILEGEGDQDELDDVTYDEMMKEWMGNNTNMEKMMQEWNKTWEQDF